VGYVRSTTDYFNHEHVNHDHDTDDHYDLIEHHHNEHNLIEHDHHDAANELRALVSRCVYSAAAAGSRLLTDPVPQLSRDLHRPAARPAQVRQRPRRHRMRKLS
jgi:hypothetical protein